MKAIVFDLLTTKSLKMPSNNVDVKVDEILR